MFPTVVRHIINQSSFLFVVLFKENAQNETITSILLPERQLITTKSFIVKNHFTFSWCDEKWNGNILFLLFVEGHSHQEMETDGEEGLQITAKTQHMSMLCLFLSSKNSLICETIIKPIKDVYYIK